MTELFNHARCIVTSAWSSVTPNISVSNHRAGVGSEKVRGYVMSRVVKLDNSQKYASREPILGYSYVVPATRAHLAKHKYFFRRRAALATLIVPGPESLYLIVVYSCTCSCPNPSLIFHMYDYCRGDQNVKKDLLSKQKLSHRYMHTCGTCVARYKF